MGAFIFKQPNGLYGRFSTVVDCITHYNMTEEEYLELKVEDAREEVRRIFKYYLKPYNMIDEYFRPTDNMSREEFEEIKKKMREPYEQEKPHWSEQTYNGHKVVICSNCSTFFRLDPDRWQFMLHCPYCGKKLKEE